MVFVVVPQFTNTLPRQLQSWPSSLSADTPICTLSCLWQIDIQKEQSDIHCYKCFGWCFSSVIFKGYSQVAMHFGAKQIIIMVSSHWMQMCPLISIRVVYDQFSKTSARSTLYYTTTPVLLPGKSHGRRSLVGSLSLFTFMHWRRKW